MACAREPRSQDAVLSRGLPDFTGDRYHVVEDARSGSYLEPGLPGTTFEWPTVAQADWNEDGLYDLLVGYNLREPDEIRMVVYLNQGRIGSPEFTGEPSPSTCFYVEALLPGQSEPVVFENDGFEAPHREHKFPVFMPAVYDFDGDGRFDILVNEGVYDVAQGRGQWLLLNVGEPGAPAFRAVYLHGDDVDSQLPPGPYLDAMALFHRPPDETSFPSFSMLDWDDDGVADLQYSGVATHVVFGALGGDGRWGPREAAWSLQVPAGGESFGRLPHLVTADFDGDGRSVLVAANATDPRDGSSNGYLSLYEQDVAAQELRYRLAVDDLFSLNGKENPFFFPDRKWPYLFSDAGWWYPRLAVVDFDEDGDPDLIAGWGGGNDQRQVGNRMYLYRTPGGQAGARPRYPR